MPCNLALRSLQLHYSILCAMYWAMEHAGKIDEFKAAAQLLCLLVPFHRQLIICLEGLIMLLQTICRYVAGQWAMEQAGLFDKFMASAQPEAQDMRVMDKDGSVLWEETDCTHMDRPEVCAPPPCPPLPSLPCHGPRCTNTRNKRTQKERIEVKK